MDIERLNSGLMGRLPPRLANWLYKHLKNIPAVKATVDKELEKIMAEDDVMVLVHGWTLDHRSFELQVQTLASRFTVVTLDRRSYGKSTGRPDLWAELDDLDRVIDEYGGGAAHLLGVSQGGRVALRYAATRPDRVRSLVLQGAVLDQSQSPPLEERACLEYLCHQRLGLAVALPTDRAGVLVLHPMLTLIQLSNQHQSGLHYIQRLETRYHNRLSVLCGECLVRPAPNQGTDMGRPEKTIDLDRILGLQNGAHRRRRQHMVAEGGEISQTFGLRLLDRHRSGRGGGFETDGHKYDFPLRVVAGDLQGVLSGVDHTHIRPLRPGLEQAVTITRRNP